MVKLLYGPEPYLINKEINKEKDSIEFEVNLMESESFGKAEVSFLETIPFVDAYRVLIYECDELKPNQELLDYIQAPYNHSLLLIKAKKVDKRSKIFKELTAADSVVYCGKIDRTALFKMIHTTFRNLKTEISDKQVDTIITNSAYLDNDDVNLYTVSTLVRQVSFASNGVVSDHLLTELVSDNTSCLVWDLTEALSQKDPQTVFSLANKLLDNGENELQMLSAILYNFRVAYKASLYKDKGKELSSFLGARLYTNPFVKLAPKKVSAILDILSTSINQLKSGYLAKPLFLSTLSQCLTIL